MFAVDPKGAGGNGHLTLYYQDKGKNWHSYDQGAAKHTSVAQNLGIFSGKDVNAVVTIGDVSKNQVPQGGLHVATNSKQDELISKSANESAELHNSGKLEYNVYSNNCTDAAVNVVNNSGAGISIYNPSSIVKPNTWIKEVMKNPKEAITRKEEVK